VSHLDAGRRAGQRNAAGIRAGNCPGIAGGRLVTVLECGHLSTLERPQAVTEALVDWMQA
jgi:hypothetical protein